MWIARHWLFVFNLGMALFVGGTLLAPWLMFLGLEEPARAVYTFYGLNCHQLPERSYFLFGPNGIDTYSLEQVLAWGADPGYLRGFVGNAGVGFKMAMAGRNTAIYSTLLVAGLAFAVVRAEVTRLASFFTDRSAVDFLGALDVLEKEGKDKSPGKTTRDK